MLKTAAALLIAIHAADATAPEWLHMLPAGQFSGMDGRGPYLAPDLEALIAIFNSEGRKLPVDENHAIDLAAKAGNPAPARGWIVELQAREDGLWGRVEWTEEGQRLVVGKAYGYLSPVFLHTPQKPYRIGKVLRVALTNDPNLNFLTALHQREESEMLEQLRKALGLPETATEADVLAAVASAHQAQQETATHAALVGKIVEAVGLPSGTSGDALVTALQSRGKVTPTEAENAELRSSVTSLQSQLTTLISNHARDRAVVVVEDAVKAGKIVPALKEHMIARHMKDPTEVEKEISLLPSINSGGLGGRKVPEAEGGGLTDEDRQVAAMMGVDETTFAASAKALHGKGN
uniref:Mu-like prophage I protein n=1 Tax=Agrobacterium albertimagni TaxID=147266 RepID=A0A7C1NYP6_9HYPH